MRVDTACRTFGAFGLMLCLSASAVESCPLPPAGIKTENQAIARAVKAVEMKSDVYDHVNYLPLTCPKT